ncbi:MAG: cytochrome C [Proteobacteria bacterium]|nr:cytochrome C [Pseudomonadota bacterium]
MRSVLAVAVLAATSLLAPSLAFAVPSFARQTGMACEACHTVYPELTHFGRVFKANGYILTNVRQVRDVSGKKEELLSLAQTVPLSIMAQVSYTQMKTSVPDLTAAGAPGVAQNGSAGFPQQLSLFYAGKIAPNFGAFFQLTYANDSGTISMDNTDLRFADTALMSDNHPLTYGVSLNNNPTVQDLWNSTPAWGFPFAASNANVSPLAGTAIDGAFAQDVAGLTAYVLWNESLYAEVGGYRSAKQGSTNALTGGAGPLDGTASNVMSGVAPYWRVAYEHNWKAHSLEVGAYGAQFRLYPGAGAPLEGPLNEFKDVAEDLQYQFIGDENIITVGATHIHEAMTLAPGSAANPSDTLNTSRAWVTYYYRRHIGGTVGYFSTSGSADPGLYPAEPPPSDSGVAFSSNPGVVTSANGSPDTRGWIAEVNYVPWLNVKISAQYTMYNQFNGASKNYDGVGRNASDNNTLYLLLWFAY